MASKRYLVLLEIIQVHSALTLESSKVSFWLALFHGQTSVFKKDQPPEQSLCQTSSIKRCRCDLVSSIPRLAYYDLSETAYTPKKNIF